MPSITRMSKANSRKSNNKKRIARKAQSYANSRERADKRRHKNDYQPGFKPPIGTPQNKIPHLYHGINNNPQAWNVIIRDDKKPVYEKV